MPEHAKRLSPVDSVCPQCLRRIRGELIQREQTVFLEKSCPEHGFFSAVVWRGEPPFSEWVRPKIPFLGGAREPGRRGCPFDCGLCPAHAQRTCTALVEVTQRCNLRCPVCFADSGGSAPDPDMASLRRMFDRIMDRTGGCNLQLSGGEPTVREDLPDVIRTAKDTGFSFVQLNSNGLSLARDPELAHAFKDAGLSSVFLQFDGMTDAVFRQMRGRDLLEEKIRAVENLSAAGLGVVLVPTVRRDVNLDRLWDVVRFGLDRLPHVRGVHFQPMSYFGRFPSDFSPHHVTLPEIMNALERQSRGMVRAADFLPPGCEHALCSFSGRFLVREDGTLTRLGSAACDCAPQPAEAGALKSITVTARQWSAPDAPPDTQSGDDLDRFLRRARTHVFGISAMAFQDAWTLNLERLRGCCIHVAQPDGRLIPFCSFNLTSRSGQPLYRDAALENPATEESRPSCGPRPSTP